MHARGKAHSWECQVFQVCQRRVEQRHSSHFSQIMSQTSRSGSGNLVTTPDLTKLLRDVEATGFSRDSVDLAQVFKGQESFYGVPGSRRRFQISRKFYQLRRNSLANYCKCKSSVFGKGRGVACSPCSRFSVQARSVRSWASKLTKQIRLS